MAQPIIEHAVAIGAWQQHRERLDVVEQAGGQVATMQLAQSYGEAVRIFKDVAPIVLALNELIGAAIGQTWYDLGGALTCSEAEAFAKLLGAAGHPEAASDLLASHLADDEAGGDTHTKG